MANNPKRNLSSKNWEPASAALQKFYPELGGSLFLMSVPVPRITNFGDGMPHTEFTLGIGNSQPESFADIKCKFRGSFMPGCCGLGLIYMFGGTERRPEVWDQLLNETLWKNAWQVEVYRQAEAKEYNKFQKGSLDEMWAKITKRTAMYTNNYWMNGAIETRMWFPTDYVGVKIAA